MTDQVRDRLSGVTEQPSKTTGRLRLITNLLFLFLLMLAVFGRTAHYRTIFPASGDVRLLGVDPYYHLRHTRFTAENFPRLMRADVGTHYPTGLRDDAAGLFNISLAAIALTIGAGQPSDLVISYVLAWSPVVLFVLTSSALFWLTSLLLGHRGGPSVLRGIFPFPRRITGAYGARIWRLSRGGDVACALDCHWINKMCAAIAFRICTAMVAASFSGLSTHAFFSFHLARCAGLCAHLRPFFSGHSCV